MVKILIKITEFFSKKKYLNKEKRVGYKTRTKNNLENELDKKISNMLEFKLNLLNKEKQKGISISVLLEIVEEDPDYYTKNELNYLINELV